MSLVALRERHVCEGDVSGFTVCASCCQTLPVASLTVGSITVAASRRPVSPPLVPPAPALPSRSPFLLLARRREEKMLPAAADLCQYPIHYLDGGKTAYL